MNVLPQDKIDLIRKMLRDGVSIRKIAAAVDVNRNTVLRYKAATASDEKPTPETEPTSVVTSEASMEVQPCYTDTISASEREWLGRTLTKGANPPEGSTVGLFGRMGLTTGTLESIFENGLAYVDWDRSITGNRIPAYCYYRDLRVKRTRI